MASTTNEGSRLGSLLDESAVGVYGPQTPRKSRWDRRLDDAVRRRTRAVWNDPKRRNIALGVLIFVTLGATIGIYFAARPARQPDFTTANIDVLFNYTLLTEEFNRLPIEERIELIAQLVQRLKTIDADQSLLMAAFAAQIQGEIRKQFERNASLLAVDLFDSYAEDFDSNAPPADRDAFVEAKFLEFEKTLERIAGIESEKTDEERVIGARKQAKRDLEFVQSGRMPVENTVRMLTFVDQGVGREASGHQKIRINGFLSQMVRTLREGEVPPEEAEPEQRRREREPEPTVPPETPMIEPGEIAPVDGAEPAKEPGTPEDADPAKEPGDEAEQSPPPNDDGTDDDGD